MRRVALASFVGTAIEYYDFFIYGTAAALVFPDVFFPSLSPTVATVASLSTFAVAFLSRPVGAAVFGHFGDRLGRKRTLVATLSIMGLSTVAVGLVPGADSIGLAAPLLLMLLRLLQGFAVGGEWAGSALLSAEYAPPEQRGRYGMFTQLGVGAGLVLGNLVFLLVNLTVGETDPTFMSWGWRVPFVFSAVLLIIALYIRVSIEETPVFVAAQAEGPLPAPLSELFNAQLRQTLLASGCMIGVFTFSFMGGTYLMSYASTILGHPRELVLSVGVLGGVAMLVCTALSAWFCDVVGRRQLILTGFCLAVPWSFAVMPLMNTGSALLFGLAIVGTYAILGIASGPMAAFLPEIFATRYRYSGAGLAFNLGGIVGGAVPPLIAGPLVDVFGINAIGLMMAVLVGVSLTVTYLLPDTKGAELSAPVLA
ncbi:MFS transporter [Mycolicibacterium mengxianglii]|uniref:MFS transporter n=1 Tax=Mycolicibacterium mengxianglii TaxID=2736649 RepID=UPI0018D05A3A|nr:MFS transporter [Mycolicibacterium mengxianglii]